LTIPDIEEHKEDAPPCVITEFALGKQGFRSVGVCEKAGNKRPGTSGVKLTEHSL